MKGLILDIVRAYRKFYIQAWDHYFESVGRPRSERASVTNSEQRKWVAKPNTKEPTANTTCMNVITSRLEDEPQYDFGEYADRLWKIAYERGKREALEQTEPTISKMEQVDEPQTDRGDFADRLAYERGVKHAWEVAQKVFDSTVTFYEAEDVAKQITKDEPQTEREDE